MREDYTKVFVMLTVHRQILEFCIFLFRSLYVVTYKMRRRLRILVRILYVVRFRTFAFSHFAFYTYPIGDRQQSEKSGQYVFFLASVSAVSALL